MDVKHVQKENKCLNCEAPLDQVKDNFCPSCGQLNNSKKETAFELLKDLVGDFLHLDSKVMGTIIPLLFKPGWLTIQYIAGKRARYLHPVKMFISIMIIFVIISGLGNSHDEAISPEKKIAKDSIRNAVLENLASKDSLELADSLAKNKLLSINKDATNFNISYEDNATIEGIRDFSKKGVTDVEVLLDSLHKEKTFINKVLYAQGLKLVNLNKMKAGLKEYIGHKLPWIVFSLMPVFAFVLWMLYARRKLFFVDHLVYAFHIHAFFFLLLSILNLIDYLTAMDLSVLANFYMIFYIPVSMKKVYQQSWKKTLIKMFLLIFGYMILGLFSTFFVLAILFLLY